MLLLIRTGHCITGQLTRDVQAELSGVTVLSVTQATVLCSKLVVYSAVHNSFALAI